jgi:cell pole-organizing protein PopZ
VSTKKAESEALLSTGTASTTTGAFAKLSKAFRPTPVEESVADGAGRTVEQFIEDMARPMLKEWLDENMPAIVERLVQKEIQKIARRAELL